MQRAYHNSAAPISGHMFRLRELLFVRYRQATIC